MKRKRLVSIIATVLIVTLMAGILAIPATILALPGLPFDVVDRVADPETDARKDPGQMGFIDIPRVHDGRIWADKTVNESPAERDEFIVTLSALSQNFPLNEGYAIPADTVFVIDVSGSMHLYKDAGDGRIRIDVLVEALNEAIGILLDANPQNRIAVVAYGGGTPGTGLGRVENLLPLGRYTAAAGSNEFFSFIPNPSVQYHHLRVNVGTNPRTILVNGSTPTQWGIFEGAKILEQASPKTAVVPRTDALGNFVDNVTVTRRPNLVLMTDGEPTIGWTNYAFAASPANPLTPPGPAGGALLSTSPPPNAQFFGDGSYGEMGVSILTVLTAAHRKRIVHNNYFPAGWDTGQPTQPTASVGFYTIAFGDQPTDATKRLIRATMNPGLNAVNADAVDADIRRENTGHKDSLTEDPNYVGKPGGQNIFKQNPWSDPAISGDPKYYNPKMGDLLRAFAATPGTAIEFHAARRQAMNTYIWDEPKVSVTNNVSTPGTPLTAAELDYATMFREAKNLDDLRTVFQDIATSIQKTSTQNTVTKADPDHEDFDGYLTFTDVLGDYMQVRSVTGIEYNNNMFTRDDFATAMTRPGDKDKYTNTLLNHLNYGAAASFILDKPAVERLIASNIASSDFMARKTIIYYANTNRDYLGSFFNANGTPAAVPAGAAAKVEVFPMWGDMNVGPAPPSGETDLSLITFHVITAIRDAEFKELFATSEGGDPLTRSLKTGDQMIRWYIPASLIPLRTLALNPDGTFQNPANPVSGNTFPIRVNYTVGLDRVRVSAGIPWEFFNAERVSGSSDQLYFYSNRHTATGSNVTLAFYQPHPQNPYYNIGVGFEDRGVIKEQNRTETAVHVSTRTVSYRDGNADDRRDTHWLGNNGRLTLRLDDPPPPPQEYGNLLLAKTFTGLPTGIDVFDNNAVSRITFLVVGTNADNQEIYRRLVEFNSTNFKWNADQSRHEFLLTNVPLGNYRIYERGGNITDYVVNRPGPPQLATISGPGTQVTVNHTNDYTHTPVPPEDWPAITVWKVFHGLTNEEIPQNFQLRLTGPDGFDRTLTVEQAISGQTYRNLPPGNYTIAEIGNSTPGFTLTVTVNNQSVSLPHTFAIASGTAHISFVVDNTYLPVRPSPPPTVPSPKTGVDRNLTIPVIVLALGAFSLIGAEIYRRKSRNKAK